MCILWYICFRLRKNIINVSRSFVSFETFIIDSPRHELYFEHWNVIISLAMVAASKVFCHPVCLTDTVLKCYIMSMLASDLYQCQGQVTTWICYLSRGTFGMNIEDIAGMKLHCLDSPLLQQAFLREAFSWWVPIMDGILQKILLDNDHFRQKRCPQSLRPFLERISLHIFDCEGTPFSSIDEEHELEMYLQDTLNIIKCVSSAPDYCKRCYFERFFDVNSRYSEEVTEMVYIQIWSPFCESNNMEAFVAAQDAKLEPFFNEDEVNLTVTVNDIYIKELRILATWRHRMSRPSEVPWNMLAHSVRPMVKEEGMDTNFKFVNSKLQPESHSLP